MGVLGCTDIVDKPAGYIVFPLAVTRPTVIWRSQITSTPASSLLHYCLLSCVEAACLLFLHPSAGTVLVHSPKSPFQRGCVHHHRYTTARLTVTNVGLKRTNVSESKVTEYSYREIPGSAVEDLARMSGYVPSPGSCLAADIHSVSTSFALLFTAQTCSETRKASFTAMLAY